MNHTDHADALSTEGFTIARNVVPRDLVQSMIVAADRAFKEDVWLDPSSGVPQECDIDELEARRDRAIEQSMPSRREVLMQQPVRGLLKYLLQDEPTLLSEIVPFRYSPSRTRPALASEFCRDPARNGHVHHFSHWEPRRGAIMVWLALEDIEPTSGPMWVCPASHRRNLILFDDVLEMAPDLAEALLRLRLGGAPYPEWGLWFARMQKVMTELIESRIDAEQLERRPVLLNAGDMIFFDMALSHGTIPPTNPNQTRWSLVARFQGRHTVERSWASWLGGSIFKPAIAHVPPADYELEPYEDGWVAVNHGRDHVRMFWDSPLPER